MRGSRAKQLRKAFPETKMYKAAKKFYKWAIRSGQYRATRLGMERLKDKNFEGKFKG